jgi:hypothetical protein
MIPKYNLEKNSSKRNLQNPSRYYYTSIITNLKFQHKPKYPQIKIVLLTKIGPKSLKLLYLIMNPNTISLPSLVGKANKRGFSVPILLVDEKEEVSKERNRSGVWTIKGPFTSYGVL